MKKWVPFLLGFVLIIILGLLMYANQPARQFNPAVTLRHQDKNPYGTYIAFRLLPGLFPKAAVEAKRRMPELVPAGPGDSATALILPSKEFNADEEELDALIAFARQGNYVFIVTRELSYSAREKLGCSDAEGFFMAGEVEEENLSLTLNKMVFPAAQTVELPGVRFDNLLSRMDTPRTLVLGTNRQGRAQFIQLNAGKGRIFLHLAPLAFSNYFLLRKGNAAYFRQVLSVLPKEVSRVEWNDYFLYKPQTPPNEKGWLDKVMEYPGLRAGLLTAFGVLLLFTVLGFRRRQRPVPPYMRPRNDSLDFVKTIGRLYYDKSDHGNLGRKMGAYFLEHVRSQYKLATHELNDTFLDALHAKSGYPREDLKTIVEFIQFSETAPTLSEAQLHRFYKQLETYYQKT